MIRPYLAALLLLAACTPQNPSGEPPRGPADAAPTAPTTEEWRLLAMQARKGMPNPGPGFPSSEAEAGQWQYAALLDGLLKQPDPPATPGPELPLLPADGTAIAWPAPKEGVLTVRYRMSRIDCRSAGSDMGCHLGALCPLDTSSTVPVMTLSRWEKLGAHNAEVVEVPSPRCELRLYAQDHHGSAICTARGPKLPASWSGAAVLDIGIIQVDEHHGICDADPLAERMLERGNLTLKWREVQAQQKKP